MSTHRSQWQVSTRLEKGDVREENQDRMASEIKVDIGDLYIVADGMGGHKAGALAAELTVEGLQQHLRAAPAGMPVEKAIRQAFEKTNMTVYEEAHSGNPETEGMGSTVVVLLLTEGATAYVAHVGDSRAYLYRKGQLQQLTTDHTRVQRMVTAGILTPAQAREHPDASLLERAVGQKPQIDVDINPALQLKEGDGVLLCSDGLCGYVDDREIKTVLRSRATVQELSDCLVELALQKGGYDNIAVQFIQYGERTEAQRNIKHIWYQIVASLIALALLAGWYVGYYRKLEEPPAFTHQLPKQSSEVSKEGEKAVSSSESDKQPSKAPKEEKRAVSNSEKGSPEKQPKKANVPGKTSREGKQTTGSPTTPRVTE